MCEVSEDSRGWMDAVVVAVELKLRVRGFDWMRRDLPGKTRTLHWRCCSYSHHRQRSARKWLGGYIVMKLKLCRWKSQ